VLGVVVAEYMHPYLVLVRVDQVVEDLVVMVVLVLPLQFLLDLVEGVPEQMPHLDMLVAMVVLVS
jgi:hypothetical protein